MTRIRPGRKKESLSTQENLQTNRPKLHVLEQVWERMLLEVIQPFSIGCGQRLHGRKYPINERPALAELLGQLRVDGVLLIWKLDRMGRSLAH